MILKKIKLKIGEEINVESYKSSGIYEVNNWVYYVNKESHIVFAIDSIVNFNAVISNTDIEIEEPLTIEKEQTVSEDLLLKTIALAMNKEKYKDLK